MLERRMTSPLTADRVIPLLRSSFGQTYRHYEVCASSQDQLLEGDPEGTIVVCEEQSAGRGRRGRSWQSPRGRALLASILLRPPPSRTAAELTLVAGAVTAALIEEAIEAPAGIKWPNDVLIDGKKVAGILAEKRDQGLVLGIGINVNQTSGELPGGARLDPTSLRIATGREWDRAELLSDLAYEFEAAYLNWLKDGLSAVSAALAHRDVLHGRRVRVDAIAGIACGIDTNGALLVDTPAGTRSVVAGEVEIEW
jgi:BirA family biotin operon repressor/biotin-[acetyl-CoA-carboxylase] ligase